MIQRNASVWESSNIHVSCKLSTIVIRHWMPEKTNTVIVGMSPWSEFITGRGELASIVLIDLNPHSLSVSKSIHPVEIPM